MFSIVAIPIYITTNNEGSLLSTPSPAFIVDFLVIAILTGVRQYLVEVKLDLFLV